ncbi:MAG TPA: hypothetical protein VHI98_25975 [Vicinamibacterales bacterium]|jgi:hypothetical protein|nr:hypothetical protein [Vicinamibacterales bacterium]
MTARKVVTIASLGLALVASACTSFYEIPVETPIQAKLDISGFSRVLVVGFIAGGTEDVDANLETVRLLRSQLRTKSELKVIEADVLPLAELAGEQGVQPLPAVEKMDKGDGAAKPDGSPKPDNPPKADGTSKADGTAQLPPGDDAKIRNEKDLEAYEKIFADVSFWKKLGEEYQNPLIVTGTVLFTPHSRAAFVQRETEYFDALGRRRVVPVRQYMERKGFILVPTFVFIDGRTGTRLHRESYRKEVLYPSSQNTPALSSYFELMDQVIPEFLGALSTTKIRGSRVLLK